MKLKIFIVAASLLFLSSISYSQTTNYKNISLGIIGGVNIANVKFDPKQATEPDSKTGILAGAIAEFGISKNFAIMPAVEYIMKGYKVKSGTQTGEVKLDYIEIPLLFKARFPGKTVTPYIAVGPTLGLRMSAKVKNDSTGSETDIKDDVKSSDFGLFFGAGSDFKIAKKTSLFLQAGYSLGLSDINNTTAPAGTTAVKLKNHGIQITAGVKFGLK